MDSGNPSNIEAEAEALIDAMMRPKRRVRPRIAEAFRDAEDRQVETPFGPVMTWRLGKGLATLLVHGWEDDNCLWGALADKFAQVGRAVVAFDLPGHGFSPAEDASPAAASAAVRAVAEACGPIDTIVAHSYGCPVSMQAMTDGLSIKRVALIATPIPKMSQRWARAERRGVSPEVIERAIAIFAERQSGQPPAYDMEEAAANMTAKALFVHSLDDEDCPASNSQALKRIWPGAKLALTDELGHRLIAQDSAMLDRVVDFIEGFEQ
ncbi:MAG: alpha/beta fold hydrolase [Parvibaculum sp.]|uniref:alpha/beta fold hydrolase n=1 Tax=Parvibaculum sp. TaxID=2024848 RepID=UPI003C710CFF